MRQDITPPLGIYARNWGASSHDQAEGVHRPLTLTALTLQDSPETKPLVLVAMDGGWWKTHEDEWLVRNGILDALSLDPARVILHLSHTHSGSSLSRKIPAWPTSVTRIVRTSTGTGAGGHRRQD